MEFLIVAYRRENGAIIQEDGLVEANDMVQAFRQAMNLDIMYDAFSVIVTEKQTEK